VVDDDGHPQKLPWEDWREGDADRTSAWVRATAPNGNAAFEGKVGWSGELGYGVRAPEKGQTADSDRASATKAPAASKKKR
jgi:NADH-quinone oxidoreductase subunit I